MKIVRLELYKYTRILLTGIETFVYVPTQPLQLILGTNGSGKSSLLSELTPLPSSHLDFGEGGYKIIDIEHNNSVYCLTNSFSGKQEHSFVKDMVELNQGGTVTVQRELVKQEFGLTPEIHELLISQVNFSGMSANDRRLWFTKLSDVSYDYAIRVYNKLKERSWTTSGALKHAKKRLVIETAKIINVNEKISLECKVNDLHELLGYLQGHRKPVEQPLYELNTKYSTLEQMLLKTSNNVLTLMSNNTVKYKSTVDIDCKLEYFKTHKAVVEEKISNLYKQYSEIESSLKVIKQNIEVNSSTAKAKLDHIEEELFAKYKLLKLSIDPIENPVECINALNTIYDLITSIFLELKENEDMRYSRVELGKVTIALGEKNLENKKLISDLTNLVNSKLHQEHQRDNAKTECPKCNHTWSRGYDEAYYNKLCITIDELQKRIDDNAFEILDLTNAQEAIKEYSTTFNQLLSCTTNWVVLKPLWDLIFSNNNYLKAPRTVINVIDAFKNDLQVYNSISQLKKQLIDAQAVYEIAKLTDVQENERILAKANEIETAISELQGELNRIDKRIRILNEDKKTITYILELNTTIEELSKQLETNVTDRKETIRREALNSFIQQVQIDLSNKEKILSEIKQQYALVEDITSQIEKLDLDNESLKVLVSELSPTDGLIAKGLLGFINNYVTKMNKFIKKIWAYPLVIKTCKISDENVIELDYKFPLVAGSTKPVKDVSKGSSAMQEVVDLAFKITAMGYLGLSHYPLYLDEPSSTMDNEHKITSMRAIVGLMEQQNFTQLFLVSHDHVQYGSLINTEVCILCANNIVLPAGSIYNRHVEIS